MKDDFLTIPDCPNYEINSDLVVRNKKSGYVLSRVPHPKGKNLACHLVNANHKPQFRVVKTLRQQALAAHLDADGQWVPVASANNQYEIDKNGRLRNSKTKQLLTLRKGCYRLYFKKTFRSVSRRTLLWEVFGIAPPYGSRVHKACILSHDNQRLFFDDRISAARFLSKKHFYSANYIQQQLAARKPVICGWNVNYLESNTNVVARELNADARRNKKAWDHHAP